MTPRAAIHDDLLSGLTPPAAWLGRLLPVLPPERRQPLRQRILTRACTQLRPAQLVLLAEQLVQTQPGGAVLFSWAAPRSPAEQSLCQLLESWFDGYTVASRPDLVTFASMNPAPLDTFQEDYQLQNVQAPGPLPGDEPVLTGLPEAEDFDRLVAGQLLRRAYHWLERLPPGRVASRVLRAVEQLPASVASAVWDAFLPHHFRRDHPRPGTVRGIAETLSRLVREQGGQLLHWRSVADVIRVLQPGSRAQKALVNLTRLPPLDEDRELGQARRDALALVLDLQGEKPSWPVGKLKNFLNQTLVEFQTTRETLQEIHSQRRDLLKQSIKAHRGLPITLLPMPRELGVRLQDWEEAVGWVSQVTERLDAEPLSIQLEPSHDGRMRWQLMGTTATVALPPWAAPDVLVHALGHVLEQHLDMEDWLGQYHSYRLVPRPATTLAGLGADAHAPGAVDDVGLLPSWEHGFPRAEVLANGLQTLYADSDQFLRNDPEYACLVIHLLAGLLRPIAT